MLYQANTNCKGACPKWEKLAFYASFYAVCTAHPVLVSITHVKSCF